MSAFTIRFQPTGDGVAQLRLPSTAALSEPDDLRSAITVAVEAGFADDGLDRLEVLVRETDHRLRWAVIRSGFRLEGRRRRAARDEDNRPVDELIFGRLRSDVIGGANGFSAVANTITPRKRLIAHALMRDSAGRILLCETTFKTDWELPGGIVERDESPRLGAIREIGEELGIDREVGSLLAVDWMPPYLGWDDAVELIFDGGSVTEDDLATYELDPREIIAVNLVHLADAEDHLTPLSFRRLTAITAAEPGNTLLLENGSPL